jgi:hypothetical protein
MTSWNSWSTVRVVLALEEGVVEDPVGGGGERIALQQGGLDARQMLLD